MMSNGGNPYLIPTLSEAQIKELVDANALPAVTAADAGQVLTVSETGEWAPAAGGGGGASGLVVNVLTNEQNKMYLDKNYTEITTALNNGIMPLICADQSDEVVTLKIYPFILYGTASGNTPSGMVYQVVLKMYDNLDNGIEFSSSTADGVLTEADDDSTGN